MSIRIPQKADTDTQSAFQDVEKALAELSARLDQVTELEQKVKELSIVSDTPRPSFITQGDTVIEGDLRVEGGLAVRGDVDAPQVLDGIVVATPEGIGSSAQRVVEVHGSLAVLSALSAENVRTQNLQVYGTFTHSGLVRRLSTDVTDVGNVGSGEDNLMTYTLPAGTLAADGQSIRVTAWGHMATNGNVKLLRAYFGATGILLTIAGHSPSNADWRVQFDIIRTGAATQILSGHCVERDAAGSSSNFVPAEAAPAETLANAIVIKMTGEATSNNDILHKGMIVEFLA